MSTVRSSSPGAKPPASKIQRVVGSAEGARPRNASLPRLCLLRFSRVFTGIEHDDCDRTEAQQQSAAKYQDRRRASAPARVGTASPDFSGSTPTWRVSTRRSSSSRTPGPRAVPIDFEAMIPTVVARVDGETVTALGVSPRGTSPNDAHRVLARLRRRDGLARAFLPRLWRLAESGTGRRPSASNARRARRGQEPVEPRPPVRAPWRLLAVMAVALVEIAVVAPLIGSEDPVRAGNHAA